MAARRDAEKPNMLVIFSAALCLNALLLFWVQPMFGKMALPLLGGSPSVWTTCMLFFQASLLAGYAYAHAGVKLFGVKRHALLHAVIVWLPLFVLPVGLQGAGSPPADRQPIAWLLAAMAINVGLPFTVLATSAPLLQRWFGSTGHRRAVDPYFLYAASNAGSLVALLAFPTLLEPLVPLRQQQTIWQVGYSVVAGFLTVCALITYSRAVRTETTALEIPSDGDAPPPPSLGERLRWLGLSFAPSSLMLAVTTYLSTDVAAVPLLWVLPLALYLLTFIIAFGGHAQSTGAVAARLLPLVILPLAITMIGGTYLPLWFSIPFHLLAFSVLALLCHGELAQSRPRPRHLTEFYLWLAAGGLLGGVFNTLVAPQVFSSVAEYPLAIASGCVLLVSSAQVRHVLLQPKLLARPAFAAVIATTMLVAGRLVGLAAVPTTVLLGAPLMVCFSVRRDQARFAVGIVGLFVAFAIGALVTPVQGGSVLHAERTFFGVYRVTTAPEYGFVSLIHGTTLHGRQIGNDPTPEPLTYFHRKSPIGDVFAARGETGARSVGIVGLGIGTLAAYAQPSSRWVFYEIDPAVERIARDREFFRFLEACGSRCSVVLGDARLSLARSQTAHDILVLDAFSSDAIPVHLLTTEALHVYEQKLTPNGVLAVHISNRHIRLRPVLGRLARDRGWIALARFDASQDDKRGTTASDWVVLARHVEDVGALATDPRWTRIIAPDGQAWSDDFSNVWTALRWRE